MCPPTKCCCFELELGLKIFGGLQIAMLSFYIVMMSVWPIAADCACAPVTGDMADYTAQEVTDCIEFAMDGTKTEEDEYLAICGCSGDTMEAAGDCSTTGILIATIVMRLCCLVGIVDRSVFICCAKGKPETLKKILVPDTIFVFTAFATGTVMNIRDKHGADAYIQNTMTMVVLYWWTFGVNALRKNPKDTAIDAVPAAGVEGA